MEMVLGNTPVLARLGDVTSLAEPEKTVKCTGQKAAIIIDENRKPKTKFEKTRKSWKTPKTEKPQFLSAKTKKPNQTLAKSTKPKISRPPSLRKTLKYNGNLGSKPDLSPAKPGQPTEPHATRGPRCSCRYSLHLNNQKRAELL